MHLWTLRGGKVTSFTESIDTRLSSQALGEGGPGDAGSILRRMFDEIINEGRLDVADELFAEDYVDHGPMGECRTGDLQGDGRAVARRRPGRPLRGRHGDRAGRRAPGSTDDGTHTGDGLGFPATGRRFETVSANIGLFRDGRAVEHWAEQGMFPMLTQIGSSRAGAAGRPESAASSRAPAASVG